MKIFDEHVDFSFYITVTVGDCILEFYKRKVIIQDKSFGFYKSIYFSSNHYIMRDLKFDDFVKCTHGDGEGFSITKTSLEVFDEDGKRNRIHLTRDESKFLLDYINFLYSD